MSDHEAVPQPRRRLLTPRGWALLGTALGAGFAIVAAVLCGTRTSTVAHLPGGITRRHWHSGMVAWTVAGVIAALGLVAAVIALAARRLKPGAWVPVVSLVLLAGCTLVAALTFEAPDY